ncbi:hypothetical protein [Ferviditalea candida]|uniref:Uncharacterized protein n=1 Tax=Ferviditalea candida TaxID=3108399 RepID=A0ABU5ZNC5_9BACL|nr:hypothetical protein [Paenibacillaceae bacterium T2]
MKITNCPVCGKFHTGERSYSGLCIDCAEIHLQHSHKIKDYLQQHPFASVMEVYFNTGVPLRSIREVMKNV